MERVYFTFGTADTFPYYGGYICVEGESEHDCIDWFAKKYPLRHGVLNCAFYYSEEKFKNEVLQWYAKDECHAHVILGKENEDPAPASQLEYAYNKIKQMKDELMEDNPDEARLWNLTCDIKKNLCHELAKKNHC